MIRATLVTNSAAILTFTATVLLLGCAGLSSSTAATPADPGPAAPSTHTVDLSWTASTSPDVSSYNVYRAMYTDSCGSFSRISSIPNASTFYTDSEVTGGTSYCYATTAVDSRNEESSYSNIATDVQIPPP
jgi:chitinase